MDSSKERRRASSRLSIYRIRSSYRELTYPATINRRCPSRLRPMHQRPSRNLHPNRHLRRETSKGNPRYQSKLSQQCKRISSAMTQARGKSNRHPRSICTGKSNSRPASNPTKSLQPSVAEHPNAKVLAVISLKSPFRKKMANSLAGQLDLSQTIIHPRHSSKPSPKQPLLRTSESVRSATLPKQDLLVPRSAVANKPMNKRSLNRTSRITSQRLSIGRLGHRIRQISALS